MATIYADPATVPRCQKILFPMDYGYNSIRCGMKCKDGCPECEGKKESHGCQINKVR